MPPNGSRKKTSSSSAGSTSSGTRASATGTTTATSRASTTNNHSPPTTTTRQSQQQQGGRRRRRATRLAESVMDRTVGLKIRSSTAAEKALEQGDELEDTLWMGSGRMTGSFARRQLHAYPSIRRHQSRRFHPQRVLQSMRFFQSLKFPHLQPQHSRQSHGSTDTQQEFGYGGGESKRFNNNRLTSSKLNLGSHLNSPQAQPSIRIPGGSGGRRNLFANSGNYQNLNNLQTLQSNRRNGLQFQYGGGSIYLPHAPFSPPNRQHHDAVALMNSSMGSHDSFNNYDFHHNAPSTSRQDQFNRRQEVTRLLSMRVEASRSMRRRNHPSNFVQWFMEEPLEATQEKLKETQAQIHDFKEKHHKLPLLPLPFLRSKSHETTTGASTQFQPDPSLAQDDINTHYSSVAHSKNSRSTANSQKPKWKLFPLPLPHFGYHQVKDAYSAVGKRKEYKHSPSMDSASTASSRPHLPSHIQLKQKLAMQQVRQSQNEKGSRHLELQLQQVNNESEPSVTILEEDDASAKRQSLSPQLHHYGSFGDTNTGTANGTTNGQKPRRRSRRPHSLPAESFRSTRVDVHSNQPLLQRNHAMRLSVQPQEDDEDHDDYDNDNSQSCPSRPRMDREDWSSKRGSFIIVPPSVQLNVPKSRGSLLMNQISGLSIPANLDMSSSHNDDDEDNDVLNSSGGTRRRQYAQQTSPLANSSYYQPIGVEESMTQQQQRQHQFLRNQQEKPRRQLEPESSYYAGFDSSCRSGFDDSSQSDVFYSVQELLDSRNNYVSQTRQNWTPISTIQLDTGDVTSAERDGGGSMVSTNNNNHSFSASTLSSGSRRNRSQNNSSTALVNGSSTWSHANSSTALLAAMDASSDHSEQQQAQEALKPLEPEGIRLPYWYEDEIKKKTGVATNQVVDSTHANHSSGRASLENLNSFYDDEYDDGDDEFDEDEFNSTRDLQFSFLSESYGSNNKQSNQSNNSRRGGCGGRNFEDYANTTRTQNRQQSMPQGASRFMQKQAGLIRLECLEEEEGDDETTERSESFRHSSAGSRAQSQKRGLGVGVDPSFGQMAQHSTLSSLRYWKKDSKEDGEESAGKGTVNDNEKIGGIQKQRPSLLQQRPPRLEKEQRQVSVPPRSELVGQRQHGVRGGAIADYAQDLLSGKMTPSPDASREDNSEKDNGGNGTGDVELNPNSDHSRKRGDWWKDPPAGSMVDEERLSEIILADIDDEAKHKGETAATTGEGSEVVDWWHVGSDHSNQQEFSNLFVVWDEENEDSKHAIQPGSSLVYVTEDGEACLIDTLEGSFDEFSDYEDARSVVSEPADIGMMESFLTAEEFADPELNPWVKAWDDLALL